MSRLTIALHERYEKRMQPSGDMVLVYGDLEHNIFLGSVSDAAQAVKLLDAYDQSFERRQTIAELLQKKQDKSLH